MELAKSRDFFLSREKNLTLSIVLLVGCYTALLCPAYFPRQPTIWREYSMEHELVEVLQNRSNSLLSQACRPGWSRLKLKEAYPGQLPPGVPVFLQGGEGGWSQAHSERLPPPLGLHGSEEQAARALQGLPQTSLSPELGGGLCRRCVVLGSGGVLRGSRLGPHIDRHHVIIRLNSAPVSGFEEDVGYRTTVRLTYPEGAPHSARQYSNTSLLVMALYKSSDLDWFTAVVAKQPLGWWTKLWFWQTVVESIPLHAENFRILNPEIIRETTLGFLGYPNPQQSLISLSQKVPTLGVTAVVMAIRLCDEVSLAGFGYDLKHPMTPLHYYGTLRMNAMGLQSVHDVGAEKMFLRSLVQAAAVNDLTGGVSW